MLNRTLSLALFLGLASTSLASDLPRKWDMLVYGTSMAYNGSNNSDASGSAQISEAGATIEVSTLASNHDEVLLVRDNLGITQMKSQIDAIRKKARGSGQGDIFLLIYKSLKEIGVTSYSVDLETGKRVYTRGDEQLEDPMNKVQYSFGAFDAVQIAAIIKRKSQNSNPNFDEWLKDMTNVLGELAKAGVHRYIVMMTNDTAIYLDENDTQAYIEFIATDPN